MCTASSLRVAVWEDDEVRQVGQESATPEGFRLFADSLAATGEVTVGATCNNTHAIAKPLESRIPALAATEVQPQRCAVSTSTRATCGCS
jgi:hypothetical protein